MERVTVVDEPNVDIFVPIDFDSLPPMPECFGVLWDCTHRECKNCKAEVICGTKQMDTNKSRAKEIEGDTPFLSNCSFAKVNSEQLLWTINKTNNVRYEDLLKIVSEYSGFRDKVTLTTWVDRFIINNNLKIKEGIICQIR